MFNVAMPIGSEATYESITMYMALKGLQNAMEQVACVCNVFRDSAKLISLGVHGGFTQDCDHRLRDELARWMDKQEECGTQEVNVLITKIGTDIEDAVQADDEKNQNEANALIAQLKGI